MNKALFLIIAKTVNGPRNLLTYAIDEDDALDINQSWLIRVDATEWHVQKLGGVS